MVQIDHLFRGVLLHKAIKNIEIKKLGFEKNFLDFLEYSDFIFLFFDELDFESVKIEDIKSKDFYAEFEEHLEILEKIKSEYEKLLFENSFFDLAINREYKINQNYFNNFGKIVFKASGYLTNYELELLSKIENEIEFEIILNSYNSNIYGVLEKKGFELCGYGEYLFDFKSKKRLFFAPLKPLPVIEAISFQNRIMQAGFVFKKIYDYIEIEGIEPQNIAVITPEESIIDILMLLDKNRNLNIAKGKSLKSKIYINAILENKKKYGEAFTLLLDEYAESKSSQKEIFDFLDKLKIFLESAVSKDEIEAFESARYEYTRLERLAVELAFFERFRVFSDIFLQKRIDDTSGGKITVMGVLEGRYSSFDAVIFTDFNDSIVPKPTLKELFLNSAIKRNAGIPTNKDRENLQKYYYTQIFRNAKHVSLCFVSDEQSSPSSLIFELGVTPKEANGVEYKNIIFGKSTQRDVWGEACVGAIPPDFMFSSTKLTTFFECKRKFYLQYLKSIKEPQDGEDRGAFGTILHESLKEHFLKNVDLKSLIFEKCKDNKELLLEALGFEEKIVYFIDLQNQLSKSGQNIVAMESSFESEIFGLKFRGVIDRIDEFGGEQIVIDYKYKKSLKVDKSEKDLDKTTDFQLPIYVAALRGGGTNINSAYFWDLRNMELLEESLLEQKIELLGEKIEELKKSEIEFEKCEHMKPCRYCYFKKICERE